MLHRDGPIVECRANVYILSQTLEAVKRGTVGCPHFHLLSDPSGNWSTFTCLRHVDGGEARSKCHFVFFIQNKGPQKSTSLHHFTLSTYRGTDKSLARPPSRCILFDGENISFGASLVIYINSTNIPPIMIINRIYENQNLLSL